MKGSFFRDNLEYRIDISGEAWLQDSKILGTLQVRNHGKTPWTGLETVRARLTLGNERKVKAKTDDAFIEIASSGELVPAGTLLAPSASTDPLPWSFDLPAASRITDTTKSLYLTYGAAELNQPGAFGALQLRINPHPWIEDLCSVIETNFRFPRKKVSSGDDKSGAVEVKFDPPDAKAYSMLEQLVAEFKIVHPKDAPAPLEIECTFTFNIKEVDAMKAGLALKKSKRTLSRILLPSEVILKLNNRVRRDVFEKVFGEVLKEGTGGSAL